MSACAVGTAQPAVSSATGGQGGANASSGTGGAAAGNGDSGVGDGGRDAVNNDRTDNDGSGDGRDGPARDSGSLAAPALNGGTSGRFICPAGVDYRGRVPAMTGSFTTTTGPTTNNGEGPIWLGAAGALFFTTSAAPGSNVRAIWKLALPDLTPVAIKQNVGDDGMTLDNDNNIVACDIAMSAIVRLDPATGNVLQVIADQYRGNHFQSPNDVIVRGDGNIYFSDPAYAASDGPQPKTAHTAFYRISPSGEVSIVDDTGSKDPNGVALSPDDNTLYTLITGDRMVTKWALNADGSINGAGSAFAMTAETPDGMCVDCAGNIYVGTLDGVQVFSPGGQLLGTIGGGKGINCSFGGADHQSLFITSDDDIRIAHMNIPGLP